MSSFTETLLRLKQQVDRELELWVQVKEPVSLYQPMHYTIAEGGKRIRPILLMLACEAVGGKNADSLHAAVAVELLHNFTLVHDDIMDQDDMRRGQATVHRKWNQNVAILTGDGLLALAYEALARTPSPQIKKIIHLFSEALLQVCEGQALDSEFETRAHVSMAEYLEMITKKTAKLFAIACQVGAFCGASNETFAENLKRYGENLGIAFQIQDDLLDITSEEQILGKSFASDIRQGKKTFLVVHVLENGSKREIQLLQQMLNSRTNETDKVNEIRLLFDKLGSVAACKSTIQQSLAEAEIHLANLPTSHAKTILKELLNTIAERVY